MTQEEKAKAYDEAIEVIRKCETDKYGCVIGIKPSDIFREFQESKDEKIMRALTDYFWWNLNGQLLNEFTNREVLAWLEKHGYEVVGSKFKDGDWVVRGNITAQILDVQEQYYVGIDTNGNDFTSSRFLSDDKIHLWSIKDVKDGDILVDEDNNIGIYQGKVDDVDWRSYIYLGCDNYLRGSGYHIIKNTKPATKEQRDQLEKAIADADFTFDFNKKELKKIEHDVQLTEFEEEDEKLREQVVYAINQLHVCECTKTKLLAWFEKQKPGEWSEEDEAHFDSISKRCTPGITYTSTRFSISEDINWFKSIKDRIGDFDHGYKVGFSAAKHNQWKPSEEQIRELGIVATGKGWFSKEILSGLLEQIKKLKE